MVGPFDVAWTLLKNWQPTPAEIAEMEAGRQLGMNPDASVFMPAEDEPQPPLPYEDIGERQRGSPDVRTSQKDRARSEQAMDTQENRMAQDVRNQRKLDEFMARRAAKGRPPV